MKTITPFLRSIEHLTADMVAEILDGMVKRGELNKLARGAYRQVYEICGKNLVLKVARGDKVTNTYSRKQRHRWENLWGNELNHPAGYVANMTEFIIYNENNFLFKSKGVILAPALWVSKTGKFLIMRKIVGENPTASELMHNIGCGCGEVEPCKDWIETDRDSKMMLFSENLAPIEELTDDVHEYNWIVEGDKFVLVDYAGTFVPEIGKCIRKGVYKTVKNFLVGAITYDEFCSSSRES